jgi:hypothetical protein
MPAAPPACKGRAGVSRTGYALVGRALHPRATAADVKLLVWHGVTRCQVAPAWYQSATRLGDGYAWQGQYFRPVVGFTV